MGDRCLIFGKIKYDAHSLLPPFLIYVLGWGLILWSLLGKLCLLDTGENWNPREQWCCCVFQGHLRKGPFRPMEMRGTGNVTWAGDEGSWDPGKDGPFLGQRPPALFSSGSGHLSYTTSKQDRHWPMHFFSFCHSLRNLLTIFIACLRIHSLNACVYINTIVLNLALQWLC